MALPETEDRSRIDDSYRDRFNSAGESKNDTASNLLDREKNTAGGNSGDSSGKNLDSNSIADKEQGGGWKNNTSPNTSDSKAGGGLKGALAKGAGIFKKKTGAIGFVLTLLGLGASAPFIATASLPFAILGNLDTSSLLQPLNAYAQDYLGFKIFGGQKLDSISARGDKFAGLRDVEIEQLTKKGVKFPDSGRKTLSGKTVFSSIEVDGIKIEPSNFKATMRANPHLRSRVIYTKSSYFKSAKSTIAKKIKGMFGFRSSPSGIMDADATKTKNNIVKATGYDKDAGIKKITPDTSELAEEEANKVNKLANDAEDYLGEMKNTVEDVRKDPFGKIQTVDGGSAVTTRTGVVDDVGDSVKGIGGKIFSYINTLDIADVICTAYQVAYSAQVLARTVAAYNLVKFAMFFRSALEQTKAGEDNEGMTSFLMDIITTNDAETGLAFDQSAAAQMLFNGKLSSEPIGVSILGGSLLAGIYGAMTVFHTFVGKIFTVGMGGAKAGRAVVSSACNVATNLGVQVGVTLVDFGIAFFTGGGSKIAEEGIKTGVKVGVREFVKSVVKKFSITGVNKFIQEQAKSIGEKLALKNLRKTSMSMLRGSWNLIKSNPASVAAFLIGTAGAYGMPYIVQTLSGGDIAGYLKSGGLLTFESAVTGFKHWEATNAIASGGRAATYEKAAAYESKLKHYQEQYIADMKYEAKDEPFNIQNPYSTLGSMLYSSQKAIGVANSTNIFSTLSSILTLPFKNLANVAHADDKPTQEEISRIGGNAFYDSKKIAIQVSGDPYVIFDRKYSFQDVIEAIGPDSDNPMIKHSGDDKDTDEPRLSIKSGTPLEEYVKKCHNPEAIEMDPEFINDNNSNYYDFDYCGVGGSNNPENADLFSDAVSYIHQVSPSEKEASSSSGGSGLPDGTTQELAQKILDSENVTYLGAFDDVRQQFANMAEGKPARTNALGDISVDKRLLQAILKISEKYKIELSSMVRDYNYGASVHPEGEAIDISSINGVATNGSDANALGVLQLIIDEKALPERAGIGQLGCGGRAEMDNKLMAANYEVFDDTCNHLHLALRSWAGAPKTW